jgi:primosomal protein N' (replication factor Y)
MAKRVVDVLVPVALDRAYSYRVPDGLTVAPGDIVSVPLGAREATGVVWAENPKPACRRAARAHDAGAGARAGGARRRHGARQGRSRA